MKRIYKYSLAVVAIISLVSVYSFYKAPVGESKKIKWVTIEEAQELNKKEPRKMIIDVYTDWCGWCKVMDRQTFSDDNVAKYINDNFYAVKFNAESYDTINFNSTEYLNTGPAGGRRKSTHQLTYKIASVNGRIGYPTLSYIDEKLNVITVQPGFKKAPELLSFLKYINGGTYKTENYNTFKSKEDSESAVETETKTPEARAALPEEIEKKENELFTKEKSIQDREKKIIQREKDAIAKEKELIKREENILKSEEKINEKEQELLKKEKEIKALKKELKAKLRKEREVNAFPE